MIWQGLANCYIGPRMAAWFSDSFLLSCSCGFQGPIDKWNVCGACPGNVICPNCAAEIDPITGKPGPPCGECEWCESNPIVHSESTLTQLIKWRFFR